MPELSDVLADLCCAEARALLSYNQAPNQKTGAELVRLGLLELHLQSTININCTETTAIIEIPDLEPIQQHRLYKSFTLFLKDSLSNKTSASLANIVQNAQKYFGLGLEGFNTYAIKPSLTSKDLIVQKNQKRFFIFKSTTLVLTEHGQRLKQELEQQLNDKKTLSQNLALLKLHASPVLPQETLETITCFTKAFNKLLKSSASNTERGTGLF